MNSFDPIKQPFEKGSTLIEASAGTGKTFSIAYLVLRLVVEQKIPIDSILVVTFTKAATEELKDRIRTILYKARSGFDTADETDDMLNSWIECRRAFETEDRALLEQALSNIDTASIFTIHGFCQRVMSEYPLESSQSFQPELLQDLSDMKIQIVQDYWRKLTYECSEEQARLLLGFKEISSPGALYDWINDAGLDVDRILPDPIDLKQLLENLPAHQRCLDEWLQRWDTQVQDYLTDESDKFLAKISKVIDTFSDDYWRLLTKESFLSYVSKAKKVFNDQSCSIDVQREQFWENFALRFDVPTQVAQHLSDGRNLLEASVKGSCLAYLKRELPRRMDQEGVLGFHDLVERLASLTDTESSFITQAMRSKYRAALIDEFQDTDHHQWSTFSKFFKTPDHYLYLIGDPKQAIYRFRGADIDTYFSAINEVDHRLTVGKNWRSTPNLVRATNQIFKQVENPFKQPELAFEEVTPGLEYKLGDRVIDKPFIAWTWPTGAFERSADDQALFVRTNVCRDILERLKTDLASPSDFAILVRSHSTAERYREALQAVGVPAVVKSKRSIFKTTEAESLHRVLQALLQPTRLSIVREALGDVFFGLDAEGFQAACEPRSNHQDRFVFALQESHEILFKKGLMPAVTHLIETQKVFENLAVYPDAERRITNLIHLLEMVQTAVHAEKLTPYQTLKYLEVEAEARSSELSELRLESDEKAVQIVTIHASKGLQYPIVDCPDLYKKKGASRSKSIRVKRGGEWVVSADSTGKEHLKEDDKQESLREDIRLAYVALTRAKEISVVVMPGEEDPNKRSETSLGYLLPNGAPENAYTEILEMTPQLTLRGYDQRLSHIDPSLVEHFDRPLDTRYRMSSFSRLAHDKDVEVARGKSEDELFRKGSVPDQVVGSLLPKGAHFGNLVHDILETESFSVLSTDLDSAKIVRLCRQHGVTEFLSKDTLKPDMLAALKVLIYQTVSAPINKDGDFSLKQLCEANMLKEMPFYMALGELDTELLATEIFNLAPNIPFNPIKAQKLVGHMNGFIDLIAQHESRFYVMDYKTNDLQGDYSDKSMHRAMTESNYGLQGLIYSVALHRYLKRTVDSYRFVDHFGGVRYLFVRGMKEDCLDQGVYRFDPSEPLIEKLDQIFAGELQHVD